MAQITNTFAQGMDQDSSKNKYDNRHYYEAENVRIFTQNGLSSGALEDIKGTLKRIDIDALSTQEVIVIGYTVLRDNLVLFITENVNNNPDPKNFTDYIIAVPIADIEALTGTSVYTVSKTYFHSGGNLIYTEDLGFTGNNPIQAIPRYENQYVQKVYWVDGYNYLRYINIIHDSENNDLTTLPIDRLEVIGDIELTTPVVTEGISGNLRSGMVQYAYQLYMKYGSQTAFSNVTGLHHITEASDIESDSRDYFGSHIDVNTGKGFNVSVTVESDYYTRLRLVALHYSTLNDEPEIRIVEEIQIPSSTSSQTIIISDIGQNIGTLTLEEFRTFSTSLFKPKTIETKDNILFAGNIEEDSFDVDFDARAYRFAGASSTPGDPNYAPSVTSRRARLFEEDGTYYEINGSTKATTYEPASTSIGDWEDIPEEADCINQFNDQDNDGDQNYAFRYQSDGVTLGGEGPNVSFVFDILENFEIDSNAAFTYITEDLDGSASNYSYNGYASPVQQALYTGYQRDEVYRFGIVFFDKKGRSSFVKWICDIRMPSIVTEDVGGENFRIVAAVVDEVQGRILYPKFTVNNTTSLSGVESWQIVRVKRQTQDRSIFAQGLVLQPEDEGTANTVRHADFQVAAGSLTSEDIYQLHSPEVAFNKNLSVRQAIDSIQMVGRAQVYYAYAGAATVAPDTVHYRYYSAPVADEFSSGLYTTIEDGRIVEQDDISTTVGSLTYLVNNDTLNKDKGICFVTVVDNSSWEPKGNNYTEIALVNYKRNVHEGRYGGITYNARSRNEYVAVSEIMTGDADVSVFKGDTFIGSFDCLYNSQEHEAAYTAGVNHVIYFPVETSINLPLRRPSCYSRNAGVDNVDLLHDKAGIWQDNSTPPAIYEQAEDYYVYNSVYSKEDEAKLFIPRPFDYQESTTFDVKVCASLTKVNGEFQDSWLKFPVNQCIEVDPQYGPLNVLKLVNNRLLFFQNRAFGVLSVNERALLETATVSQLSLGVAGLLDRYDYGKTDIGCYHWRHMVLTSNALYWVDYENRAMYKYSAGPEEASLMKGMDSWFRKNIVNNSAAIEDGLHVWRDPEYREIYITDTDNDWTIMYNEITDSFISLSDIQPNIVMNYLDKTLGFDISIQNAIHRHNDPNAQRGQFYTSWYDFSLTLLVNPSPDNISIFTNFEWLTEARLNNVDQPLTFGEITLWNDYQHTGDITLSIGSNIRRRMRKWRFTIPRARYVSQQGTVGAALTERYARLRDSHLFAKFKYTPDQTSGREFIVHDITTLHTISNK